MKRTPLEISMYKTTWMGEAHCAKFHTDDLDATINWCKEHVDEGDWHITKWISEYEHKIHFKYENHVEKFNDTKL